MTEQYFLIENNLLDEEALAITWHVRDLKEAFDQHGIPFTYPNAQSFIQNGAIDLLGQEIVEASKAILSRLVAREFGVGKEEKPCDFCKGSGLWAGHTCEHCH